jgi:putative endonuclease
MEPERFTLYILHSQFLNRFYIGYTSIDLNDRLDKHLSNHSGYTSKAKDWVIVYSEEFSDKKLAIAREKQVKGWKSSLKIRQLIESKSNY